MCYDDQARPPEPPGRAMAARGEDVVLTAADGTQFAAFRALPDAAVTAAVVIYPDVRGLHQFYKELALRFAERGIAALALDYFGRTAGLTSRAEGFEFMPHVQQLQLPGVTQDAQAAAAALREATGPDVALFVVGFCLGGSLALLTGTDATFGFAGLIPFYAGLSRDMGGGTVLDRAVEVKYPVLGHFGGADQGIPQSAVGALDEQLERAGVEHTLHIYPYAPHSFFDRRQEQFTAESAQAWQRTLAFIAARTPRS